MITDAQISELLNGFWSVWAIVTIFSGDGRPGRYVLTGQIIPTDTHNDGVPDHLDTCADTPAGAVVNPNGCSIEQLCPCEGPWKNHGDYMKQLRAVTANFVTDDLITASEQRAILTEAAKSDCGKP